MARNPSSPGLGDITMSHVIKTKMEYRDFNAILQAGADCGLVFHEGQREYRWYGRFMGDYALPEGMTADMLGRCDHAMGIPGDSFAYEVGITTRPSGGFDVLYDFWSGGKGLEDKIGIQGIKFRERYAIHAAQNAVEALGYYSEETAEGLTVYLPEGGTVEITPQGTVEAFGMTGGGCVEITSRIQSALGVTVETSLKSEAFQTSQILLREE